MKKLGEIEIVLNRGARMFIYAVCSGLFVWLAFYYIRLGIFGALVSSYLFFDVWMGVTKRLPGFWRGLRYWQKGAIVFGFIHIFLFVLTLSSPEEFSRHQGEWAGIEIFIIELPLYAITILAAYYLHLDISIFFTNVYGYYSLILFGTLAYAFLGSLFGVLIDLYLKTQKRES